MTKTSRPRVLMLTSTLPRWEGDSEPRFVLDLAKQLSDDFDIEILAPHTQGAARSEILEGIKVIRFRYWFPRWESVAYQGGITWRLRENRARIFQIPLFLCSLAWHLFRRLTQTPRINLIHAHWLIPQGLVAVLVRGLAARRVPVVTTSHGGDLFGLQGSIWKTIKRKVLRESDAVTVVSRAMADTASNLVSGINPIVIPMGTDLTKTFTPQLEPRTGPIKNLLFVGRLVERKGVKYLLEALALVVKRHPDVHLRVIGHGPMQSSLESYANRLGLKEVVSFLGPRLHHELPEYYRQADLTVFPSCDQEGFGLVMVEAMGSGCPVIASNLAAVGDVIEDGVSGTLVAPADSVELANAICSAIDEPQGVFVLADAARKFSVRNFDWAASRSKFSELFATLVSAER